MTGPSGTRSIDANRPSDAAGRAADERRHPVPRGQYPPRAGDEREIVREEQQERQHGNRVVEDAVQAAIAIPGTIEPPGDSRQHERVEEHGAERERNRGGLGRRRPRRVLGGIHGQQYP